MRNYGVKRANTIRDAGGKLCLIVKVWQTGFVIETVGNVEGDSAEGCTADGGLTSKAIQT